MCARYGACVRTHPQGGDKDRVAVSQVADLTQQAVASRAAAQAAEGEAARLAAEVGALLTRAQCAEAGVAARSDAAVVLHKELGALRDK
jgi:hypothetical protein